MLNIRKKLNRISGLIIAFSMVLTAFGSSNTFAEISVSSKQSFYEDFEGYNSISLDDFANDTDFVGGWKIRNGVGSTGNITTLELTMAESTSAASGNSLNMGFDVTNVAGPSLYINPDITIGTEDIIISGDVYIPAVNEQDAKQYVRFYISTGQEITEVTYPGWTKCVPAVNQAFGLFFYNRDDLDPANVWKVCIGAPRQSNNGFEYNSTATSEFIVTPETWYNLCYVYHPASGEVDYYINGKYLDSHPVGETWVDSTNSKEGVYAIPNLAPGKPLGNINLLAGGYQSAETAAKFDNISVVTASAADEAKFSQVKCGTENLFANWDIPVDKNTIRNITVEKMADDDITFSGDSADAVAYTVLYKGSNGVGIKLNQPTQSLEKYQVRVNGATDIYGKNADRVYNFVVENSASLRGEAFVDSFTTDKGWATSGNSSQMTVLVDTAEKQLEANALVGYYVLKSPKNMNLPVDKGVEYVDLDFDLKAEENNDADEYEAYVKLVDENGAYAAGILINQSNIKPITKSGARIDKPNASNGDMLGEWKSYRLRYYPWTGKIEVYTAASQNAFPDKPMLTSKTYLNHNGAAQREGTDEYTWNTATFGSKITGFDIQIGKVSTTYLRNIKALSKGYPTANKVKKTFIESFSTGIDKWTTINSATSTTSISYIEGDYNGRTNVIKGSTGTAPNGQFLTGADSENAPYVNISIDETVEYVDAEFDLRAEAQGTDTWQAYIMFAEANGTQRHTGVSIEAATGATAIMPLSRDGKSLSAYKVASTEYVTRGEWTTYKMRYYPHASKLEVYINNSEIPFYSGTTYATRAGDNKSGGNVLVWNSATHGNGIGGFNIQTLKANADTYVDNLCITSYSYPERETTVKAATFENVNGSMLDNKAGAKRVRVYIENATEEPEVKVNGYVTNGEFDSENGIYAAEVDPMLVGNTDCVLTVNGVDYWFTTLEGEYKASNLRFEKGDNTVRTLTTNDIITAKLDVFNSTENSETPYLIWVAYNGSEVKYVDLAPINAIPGYDETSVGQALTVMDDYTMVKAFLWDGLETLVEFTEEYVLTKDSEY